MAILKYCRVWIRTMHSKEFYGPMYLCVPQIFQGLSKNLPNDLWRDYTLEILSVREYGATWKQHKEQQTSRGGLLKLEF